MGSSEWGDAIETVDVPDSNHIVQDARSRLDCHKGACNIYVSHITREYLVVELSVAHSGPDTSNVYADFDYLYLDWTKITLGMHQDAVPGSSDRADAIAGTFQLSYKLYEGCA